MSVYRSDQFSIYRVGGDFILHNTNKPFQNGHTHLKSFSQAKQIIHNVQHNKTPSTKNQYLLTSHIRVAESPQYIQLIYELKESRRRGKMKYRNKYSKRSLNL